MELILASNNEKKLREMRAILSEMGYTVLSQREAGLDFVADETGDTFLANARIKAQAVVDVTGKPAIADDSGLCVDALGGAPGVHSAVYGGAKCQTDQDRVAYLLENMRGIADRRCAFHSTICLRFPDGREMVAEGKWRGEILENPRGDGGFGYDPVFYCPEAQKAAAEMSPTEKNALSHRGQALGEFQRNMQAIQEMDENQ